MKVGESPSSHIKAGRIPQSLILNQKVKTREKKLLEFVEWYLQRNPGTDNSWQLT